MRRTASAFSRLHPFAPFLPGVAKRAGGNRLQTATVKLVLTVAAAVNLAFAGPRIMPCTDISRRSLPQRDR